MRQAEFQVRLVTVTLVIGLVIATAASIAAWWMAYRTPPGALSEEFGLLAAVTWLLVAGFAPAWLLARGRLTIAQTEDSVRVYAPSGGNSLFGRSSTDEHKSVIDGQRARLVVFARFWQVPLGIVPLGVAVAVLWWTWPSSSPNVSGEVHAALVGLILAFPLLILERFLVADQRWVDAQRLAVVTRLALAALVLTALATGVHAFGIGDAYWVQRAIALLLLMASGELLMRGLVSLLMPPPTPEAAQVWPSGIMLRLIAGLAGGGGLRRVFRLDLSQSWGLHFMRRAAGPLLLIVLLVTWATSAIAVIGLGERGVVERLGKPEAVVGPGVSCCLPWPFGAIRRVENGQIHEVAMALGSPLANGARLPSGKLVDPAMEKTASPIMAQDQPPAAYDRLWEKAHGAESVFLVPSPGAGDRGQSFQMLNSDVRVIWRVADTDAGALGAAYRVADPTALVRAVATRALTEAFQQRTLADVIHTDREALAQSVRNQMQHELDLLASGIEVPAVVIDAIHPPPGAALAYHGVQAAGIIATTDINTAHSQQVRTRHEADLSAAVALRGREALAREIAAKAEVERARFMADRESAAVGADALELERWLQAMGKALGRAQITIVDHRLRRGDAPFLDYRPTPLPTKDQP